MIMSSDIKQEVGTYTTAPICYDAEGNKHEGVRLYIVREATKEEWLADGGRFPFWMSETPYYYQVSID